MTGSRAYKRNSDVKGTFLLTIGAVVLTACFLAGCSTTGDMEEDFAPLEFKGMSRRFLSTRQTYSGMTRLEVKGILGERVVTGYEMTDPKRGQFRPLTIENPYKTGIFIKDEKRYDVDYYVVGIKVPDDKISDDEVVPLVFFQDKLVGQGWQFLNTKIKVP